MRELIPMLEVGAAAAVIVGLWLWIIVTEWRRSGRS